MLEIKVGAAVVRQRGQVLICSRKMADGTEKWEFPGGKLELRESSANCVVREMFEELGVRCRAYDCIYEIRHDYGDKLVHLYFIRCTLEDGEIITPREGQKFRFVDVNRLHEADLLEADAPFADFLSQK